MKFKEKLLNTREAGAKLGILPNSVRFLIKHNKIQAKQTSDGRYFIKESEVDRRKEEKSKLFSNDYWNASDIEKLGYSPVILLDGTLETIKVDGILLAYKDEMLRFIENKIDNHSHLPIRICKTTVAVRLKNGVDLEVCLVICKICSNYLSKSKTRCDIYHKGEEWEFRGRYGDQLDDLFLMEIERKNSIVVKTKGRQARELNDLLVKVVSRTNLL